MGSMLMQIVAKKSRSTREMEALSELESAVWAAEAHGTAVEHSRRVQHAVEALLATIENEVN